MKQIHRKYFLRKTVCSDVLCQTVWKVKFGITYCTLFYLLAFYHNTDCIRSLYVFQTYGFKQTIFIHDSWCLIKNYKSWLNSLATQALSMIQYIAIVITIQGHFVIFVIRGHFSDTYLTWVKLFFSLFKQNDLLSCYVCPGYRLCKD